MFRYFIVQIFVTLIVCNNDKEFCDNNYIDAVLFYGYKYRITQNEFIGDYNDTTRRIENFQKLENIVNGNKRYYQSVYATNTIASDYHHTGSDGFKFFMTFNAYDSVSGYQYYQTKHLDGAGLDKIKLEDIHNTVINDDGTQRSLDYKTLMQMKHQKHKPSAFWPKFALTLFVFNANKSFNLTKAKLVIDREERYNYQFFDLNESEDKIYTALFWWKTSDEIYAVIENRNESPRNGYMYRFNYNTSDLGSNAFIPMNIKVKTFFGCNADEDKKEDNGEVENKKNNKPIIFILLLANFLLIIVTIAELLIICLTLTSSGKSKARLKLVAGKNSKQAKEVKRNQEVKTEAKERKNVFDLERLKQWRRMTKSSEKEIASESQISNKRMASTGFEPTGQHSKI